MKLTVVDSLCNKCRGKFEKLLISKTLHMVHLYWIFWAYPATNIDNLRHAFCQIIVQNESMLWCRVTSNLKYLTYI